MSLVRSLIPDRIMVGNGTRFHISHHGHVYLYPVDLNYFAKHNMYHYYLRGFYQLLKLLGIIIAINLPRIIVILSLHLLVIL